MFSCNDYDNVYALVDWRLVFFISCQLHLFCAVLWRIRLSVRIAILTKILLVVIGNVPLLPTVVTISAQPRCYHGQSAVTGRTCCCSLPQRLLPATTSSSSSVTVYRRCQDVATPLCPAGWTVAMHYCMACLKGCCVAYNPSRTPPRDLYMVRGALITSRRFCGNYTGCPCDKPAFYQWIFSL